MHAMHAMHACYACMLCMLCMLKVFFSGELFAHMHSLGYDWRQNRVLGVLLKVKIEFVMCFLRRTHFLDPKSSCEAPFGRPFDGQTEFFANMICQKRKLLGSHNLVFIFLDMAVNVSLDGHKY